MTALMIAAVEGKKEVVEALINAKANIEATNIVRGVERGGEGRGRGWGRKGVIDEWRRVGERV